MTTIAVASSRPRRIGRSIGAVLAGLIVNAVLSSATDFALIAAGVLPSFDAWSTYTDSMLLLALAYRTIYGILGCYITARLAPDRPMRHALVLGVIGVVIGTLGAIAMWDIGGHWYVLAVIAVALPAAWLGGWLYERGRVRSA
jgi:hypothetical protein